MTRHRCQVRSDLLRVLRLVATISVAAVLSACAPVTIGSTSAKTTAAAKPTATPRPTATPTLLTPGQSTAAWDSGKIKFDTTTLFIRENTGGDRPYLLTPYQGTTGTYAVQGAALNAYKEVNSAGVTEYFVQIGIQNADGSKHTLNLPLRSVLPVYGIDSVAFTALGTQESVEKPDMYANWIIRQLAAGKHPVVVAQIYQRDITGGNDPEIEAQIRAAQALYQYLLGQDSAPSCVDKAVTTKFSASDYPVLAGAFMHLADYQSTLQ